MTVGKLICSETAPLLRDKTNRDGTPTGTDQLSASIHDHIAETHSLLHDYPEADGRIHLTS